MSLGDPEKRAKPIDAAVDGAPGNDRRPAPPAAAATLGASDAREPKAIMQIPATLGSGSLRKAQLTRLQTPPPKDEAPSDEPTVVETRRVDVRVHPPATVEIDGRDSVDVFREAALELSPGRHTLRFSNPAAVAVDRVIEVPAGGLVAPIVVQLEPAPALVEVDTRGVDATVAIRPTNGSGGDKIIPAPHDGRRPVPIFFEKDVNGRFIGVLEYEVTATARGRRPVTKIVKLEAGKTLRLSLVLEDAQNAERGDATSAPATP
jgi:hypothetical protein